jgi:hypothetical protein
VRRILAISVLVVLVFCIPIACKKVDRDYLVSVGGLFFSTNPIDRARVNIPYTYDADATGIATATISYALALFPAGMTIDATTGQVSWTASATQLGSHAVEILASASTGATALQSYNLTVFYNAPPVVSSTPVTTAVYGVPYSYNFWAWDPDGDSITYSLPTAPSGMTIGSGSGQISWTPPPGGVYNVTARASDGYGGSGDQSFQITVTAFWSGDATENNPICTVAGDQENPQITSDSSGGAIITWQDKRGGSTYDIYAQSIDATGTVRWLLNGASICTASNDQQNPQIDRDGSGGALITWEDHRTLNYNDIYAQRIDAAGTVQWLQNGAPICTASLNQIEPQIASDGTGGGFLTWTDGRNSNIYDIYAQKIDGAGNGLWKPDGTPICDTPDNEYIPQIVSDGSGGAIVAFPDSRGEPYFDIFAQKIDATGTILWPTNGATICDAPGGQYWQQLILDGPGGAIITWHDNRDSTNVGFDIFAQKIDAAGSLQWGGTAATPICSAPKDQLYPRIIPDGAGGAMICWQLTEPSGPFGTTSDIYAQRVNATGNLLWGGMTTATPLTVCTVSGDQEKSRIVPDGAGGAIIVWQDKRSGTHYDIYAQRISAAGTILWTADGKPICTASGDQENPQIVSDGSGGAIITWQDKRSGSHYDIYAQKVRADGSLGP